MLFTPMPSAIAATAASVKPGLLARMRQPNRMSERMLIVPASAGRHTLERAAGGSMAGSWQYRSRTTRSSTSGIRPRDFGRVQATITRARLVAACTRLHEDLDVAASQHVRQGSEQR